MKLNVHIEVRITSILFEARSVRVTVDVLIALGSFLERIVGDDELLFLSF